MSATKSPHPPAPNGEDIVGCGQASFTLRFEYVEGNDNANKAHHLYYKVIKHRPPLPTS